MLSKHFLTNSVGIINIERLIWISNVGNFIFYGTTLDPFILVIPSGSDDHTTEYRRGMKVICTVHKIEIIAWSQDSLQSSVALKIISIKHYLIFYFTCSHSLFCILLFTTSPRTKIGKFSKILKFIIFCQNLDVKWAVLFFLTKTTIFLSKWSEFSIN